MTTALADHQKGLPIPSEHERLAQFLARWLDEDGFRFGSYCGGHWFNRRSGENVTGSF